MSPGHVLPLFALAFGSLTARAPAIAPERVHEVVSDRNVALGGCYQEGLDRDEKLRGKVSVEMKVSETGLVPDAKSLPATTIKDAEVVACVLKVMKTLDFGKQNKPATVTYAVTFEPDPPKEAE